MKYELGQLITVSDDVNDTGIVRVVGIDPGKGNSAFHKNWDYLVRDYNPNDELQHPSRYEVTEEELERWEANGKVFWERKSKLKYSATESAHKFPRESFTCNGCLAVCDCEFAFDLFNLNGDCLADK